MDRRTARHCTHCSCCKYLHKTWWRRSYHNRRETIHNSPRPSVRRTRSSRPITSPPLTIRANATWFFRETAIGRSRAKAQPLTLTVIGCPTHKVQQNLRLEASRFFVANRVCGHTMRLSMGQLVSVRSGRVSTTHQETGFTQTVSRANNGSVLTWVLTIHSKHQRINLRIAIRLHDRVHCLPFCRSNAPTRLHYRPRYCFGSRSCFC